MVRSAEAEPGAWTVAALGSRGRIVIIGCRKKDLSQGQAWVMGREKELRGLR